MENEAFSELLRDEGLRVCGGGVLLRGLRIGLFSACLDGSS